MPKLVGVYWGASVMHDTTIRQSANLDTNDAGAWSLWKYLRHFLHNLHDRHVTEDLLQHDNHFLSDIGLTRGDVEHAAHLHFTEDAVDSLAHSRLVHIDEAMSQR
jgi:uncharacterized protein YjiS (DUF1127 family)